MWQVVHHLLLLSVTVAIHALCICLDRATVLVRLVRAPADRVCDFGR